MDRTGLDRLDCCALGAIYRYVHCTTGSTLVCTQHYDTMWLYHVPICSNINTLGTYQVRTCYSGARTDIAIYLSQIPLLSRRLITNHLHSQPSRMSCDEYVRTYSDQQLLIDPSNRHGGGGKLKVWPQIRFDK